MVERDSASSPNAKLSKQLPLNSPDRVPQRILDRILWQFVHRSARGAVAAGAERVGRG
jgi:hypothetical protein